MRTFSEIAARLQAAEDELRAAKAEMRAYLDGSSPIQAPEGAPKPPPGQQILSALAGGARLTVAELAQRCDTAPTRAFREALSRLKRTGRVRAVDRGVYQAR